MTNKKKDPMTISHTISQVSSEILTFLDKDKKEDLSAFCYLEKPATPNKKTTPPTENKPNTKK